MNERFRDHRELMTEGRFDPPQFEVVFKGTSLEPFADVAPTGEVRFVVHNGDDEPHDFAVVDLGPPDSMWQATKDPVREGHRGVVMTIEHMPAGEAQMVTLTLEEGRYALISNTPGPSFGLSLFELTVQPRDGD